MDHRVDVPDLRRATLELLNQVPEGRVTTYRALALALGDPMAGRAVGQIISESEEIELYPCYRVIHSDGRIGSYTGGAQAKIEKLRAEGVPVRYGRIEDLKSYVFSQFETDKPLVKLREVQQELAHRVVQTPLYDRLETVGGVDLSYKGSWHGIGAYVLVEVASGSTRATETAEREIAFPYIPTYLAFRELPVLLDVLERVRRAGKMADVLMVDGSGILHHRHVGIASHLGVLINVPTIGVTKSLLYGEVDLREMTKGEIRTVIDPESHRPVGAAVKTTARADPIFVSVGHGVDLETAVDLTLRLSSRKLPEPIHRAHLASREAARGTEQRTGQQALDL